MDWAKKAQGQLPQLALLHAIPNGTAGKRVTKWVGLKKVSYSPAGKRARKEGVKPGIPDLHWPVPRGGYIGLYIETKAPKNGRLSDKQKEVLPQLAEQGHQVVICKGAEAIIAAVLDYWALGAFDPSAWVARAPHRASAVAAGFTAIACRQ